MQIGSRVSWMQGSRPPSWMRDGAGWLGVCTLLAHERTWHVKLEDLDDPGLADAVCAAYGLLLQVGIPERLNLWTDTDSFSM